MDKSAVTAVACLWGKGVRDGDVVVSWSPVKMKHGWMKCDTDEIDKGLLMVVM
jgi:hypothetical protein